MRKHCETYQPVNEKCPVFITGFYDLFLKMPVFKSEKPLWIACFKLTTDVSQLFPYINGVINDAMYFEKPHHIRFSLDGFICTLYHDTVNVRFFEDREQTLTFIIHLIDFLNTLYRGNDSLSPNHKKYTSVSALDVFKLLPQTSCRECGFKTCMAFALAVSKNQAIPEQCPGIPEPVSEYVVYPVYDKNGKILSHVEIEIDHTKENVDIIERQRKYVANLEKMLFMRTQEKSAPVLNGENNGIHVRLTSREVEVLHLMTEGFTNMEIANILSISPHTVKSHVIHIFNKLGVDDRTQAAVWAVRHNIVV